MIFYVFKRSKARLYSGRYRLTSETKATQVELGCAQRQVAEKKLREMLKPFPKNAKFVWCQEEPENMGAWTFIEPRLRTLFCTEIAYAGREASASPAVGALARHKREQARFVADAFSV